jgi:hypothetical protein
VDTCNRTCLLVGQTAALLAHASYAAAGPVNRADGDANNDPIHPAQQRLWKCSFLLDWHSFPSPRRNASHLPGQFRKIRLPKARRSRPTPLDTFLEAFGGTSSRLELVALRILAHSTSFASQ